MGRKRERERERVGSDWKDKGFVIIDNNVNFPLEED
jgi:hypothetical protein